MAASRGRKSLCLGGLGLRVVVVFAVMWLIDTTGGGEEAEGTGERVLEEAAPGARRRPCPGGGGGGAAQAERRGQAVRHVAGVGDGHADRHHVAAPSESWSLCGWILPETAGHFPGGDGTTPEDGRGGEGGARGVGGDLGF